MKLVFFDIDGTLLLSKGAGGKSIVKVMHEAFGIKEEIARIQIHGQTDRGIASQLFAAHQIEDSEDNWQTFIDSYLQILPLELESSQGSLLPGIPQLLERLAESQNVTMALLTGNIKQGAFKKVTYFGIDQYFQWGGFGDLHRDRNDVAREAIANAANHIDLEQVSEVFVIGDTPNDIRCGKAIEATTIGVATATYTEQQLVDAKSDYVFADLSGTEALFKLLG